MIATRLWRGRKGLLQAAHGAACAVSGFPRGRANADSQTDCRRENGEAGQNEEGQTAIELGIHIVHLMDILPDSVTMLIGNLVSTLKEEKTGQEEMNGLVEPSRQLPI